MFITQGSQGRDVKSENWNAEWCTMYITCFNFKPSLCKGKTSNKKIKQSLDENGVNVCCCNIAKQQYAYLGKMTLLDSR